MVHCLSSQLLPAEEIPASLELAFLTLGINVSTRSIRLARDLSRSLTGPLPLTPPPSGSTWTQRYPRTPPFRLIYYHTRRYNVDAKFSISKFSSLSLSLFLSLNVRSPRRKWLVHGKRNTCRGNEVRFYLKVAHPVRVTVKRPKNAEGLMVETGSAIFTGSSGRARGEVISH